MLQGDKDNNHEFSILLLLTFILWYSAIAELTFGNLTAILIIITMIIATAIINIIIIIQSHINEYNYNWGWGTVYLWGMCTCTKQGFMAYTPPLAQTQASKQVCSLGY